MRNGNGRPLGLKKKIQFMVLLTLLAWATQTLLQQWGYGQVVMGDEAAAPDGLNRGPTALPRPSAEKFVPGAGRYVGKGTLEMRVEATVIGPDVALRQICRWSESDNRIFAPVADLVLFHLDTAAPFRSITVDQLRAILHDAGVNLGVVRFAGATACTVSRSDVQYDEHAALEQWVHARQSAADHEKADTGPAAPLDKGVAQSAAAVVAAPAQAARDADPAGENGPETLRQLLLKDLSVRLSVPPDCLQVSFSPTDEKVLNLPDSLFKFQINARQVVNLGDVSWEVLIVAGDKSQKQVVNATARAWEDQVVLLKPLAYKQVIQDADLTDRRTLVDHLGNEPLLKRSQIVGQQAARELKPGTVFTARMVDAVPLARPGQLVTVTLMQGRVRIRTVARALDSGAFGQTIRVRNETTRDIYEVTLTGPQAARLGTLAPTGGMAAAD